MSSQPFIVSLLISLIGIILSARVVSDFTKDAGNMGPLRGTGEELGRRLARDLDLAQSVGAVVALVVLLFDPKLAPEVSLPLAAAAAVAVSFTLYFGIQAMSSDLYYKWTKRMRGITPFAGFLVAGNLIALLLFWFLSNGT